MMAPMIYPAPKPVKFSGYTGNAGGAGNTVYTPRVPWAIPQLSVAPNVLLPGQMPLPPAYGPGGQVMQGLSGQIMAVAPTVNSNSSVVSGTPVDFYSGQEQGNTVGAKTPAEAPAVAGTTTALPANASPFLYGAVVILILWWVLK